MKASGFFTGCAVSITCIAMGSVHAAWAQGVDPAIRQQYEQAQRQSEEFLRDNCGGNVTGSNQGLCDNVRESLRMASQMMSQAEEPRSHSYVASRSAGPVTGSSGQTGGGDPACLDPEPKIVTSECDQIDASCQRVQYHPYRSGDQMRLTIAKNGMLSGSYICIAGSGWRRNGG